MSAFELVSKLQSELADLYLTLGFLTADRFDVLKREAKRSGIALFELIEADNINHAAFMSKLSEKYAVSYDLNARLVEPKSKSFPIKFCHKNAVIPIEEDDRSLTVGLAVPSSLSTLKNLSLLIGKKVSAKFVDHDMVLAELGYIKPVHDLIRTEGSIGNSDEDEQAPADEVKSEVSELKPKSFKRSDSDSAAKKSQIKNISENGVIKAVEDIFSRAVDTDVSDIHLEVFKDFANLRFRKNGSLVDVEEYRDFLTENYVPVIARVKILANLDIAEKRLPQDGKIQFESASGKQVDFRVSVLPTNLGERIVIRILSSSSLAVSIDALGFNDKQRADFLKAIESPQGMILVTGPTGSGKSTTLYGALSYLNKPDVNILTAEDPVEYTVTGISQVQIRENIGLTFANALRSFLRQDPEIILVGEIRDSETADIATKAALTGHLVLSTLHTNSSVGAITRLVNMGLPAYLVSSALTLVVSQRLIRVNCRACIEEVILDKNPGLEDALYEMIVGSKVMHSKGCDQCMNTGFSGRRAVHEVLCVSPKIQKAINEGATENVMYEYAIAEGFEPISQVALRHIISGDLSLEEYFRVIPKGSEG